MKAEGWADIGIKLLTCYHFPEQNHLVFVYSKIVMDYDTRSKYSTGWRMSKKKLFTRIKQMENKKTRLAPNKKITDNDTVDKRVFLEIYEMRKLKGVTCKLLS